MTPNMRVMVIDDNVDITDMLRFVIEGEAGLEYAGSRQSADGLCDAIGRLTPDVLVIDASMPGDDPLEALARCMNDFPALRSIVYSGYDDDEMIERAIDASAWGFVSKRGGVEMLIHAIRSVAAGEVVFPVIPSRPAKQAPGAGRTAPPEEPEATR